MVFQSAGTEWLSGERLILTEDLHPETYESGQRHNALMEAIADVENQFKLFVDTYTADAAADANGFVKIPFPEKEARFVATPVFGGKFIRDEVEE